jgi:hypothetical protein
MRKVFRGMQIRMRNYALHHFARIDPRTLVALQELDLFDGQADPIGAKVELEVLRDSSHPRRESLPPGPLLLYLSKDEKPKRMVIEIPLLLLSELPDVRKAAFAHLERMVVDGSLLLTPKTRDTLEKTRNSLMSDNPHEWRPASIALFDSFVDDILIALQGIGQSLVCEPVIQDFLNSYAPSALYPAISSLDSITLDVRDPEKEHPKLVEIVTAVVGEASSLQDACRRYFARLGYLPLAPAYAMSAAVSGWMANHSGVDAWKEVWDWAHGAFGPLPRYHACTVFVLRPDLIPEGKLGDLWREVVSVVHDSDRKGARSIEHEPWALRRDLARHFTYHLEAHLPENESAGIACISWWLAERTASLFPDEPKSAGFYRKNWVAPAADRSGHLWLAACPRMGRSFLRYITHTVSSPWATSLLALMGTNLERLAPRGQPPETQALFHEALVSCLVVSLPFAVEVPGDPTYAMELPLGVTALKWGAHTPEEQRKALEQIVASSRTLDSVEGLCTALRRLAESSLAAQAAVTLALKAKAYNDPAVASGIWEVLSDTGWRQRTLVSVEERVLGLLIEAFAIFQVQNQDKWFSLLPHYIAELCEKTESEERRRHLFLHVVHTSLASDTVSAVRRLLRGDQKTKFIQFATEYRERVEAMWSIYPPWVEGRLRALLASLRAV